MYTDFKSHLITELQGIKDAGLYKNERIITTAQRAAINVDGVNGEVLNFCANNYLGLSDNQRLIDAAKRAMDSHGYGMSSVRFICGTQDFHKQLEDAISKYFHTEDTILYAACFDANGGLFEPLFTEEDAISMVCVCARQNAIAMPMPIWPTWSVVSSRLRLSDSESLPPTVCSQWTATWLLWTE